MSIEVSKTDFDMCRRRAGLARTLAWLLPREKGDGVVAILAGCGLVRDAICGAGSGSQCGSERDVVDLVRAQMERMYDGTLELPRVEFRDESQRVLAGFASTVARFEVPRELVMGFIEACRLDAATSRYATWRALLAHCEGVGGAVGQMIACVQGATHSDVGRFARELGAAWRLVSICASVRADLERGRVYLPLEDLVAARLSERDLVGWGSSPPGDGAGGGDEPHPTRSRVEEVVAVELRRAREMIHSASRGVVWLAGDGSKLFGAMAIEIARWRCERRIDETPSAIALMRMLPAAMRLARAEMKTIAN